MIADCSIKHLLLACGLVWLQLTPPAGGSPEQESIESRLAQVSVTYQSPDPFRPWQSDAPGVRRGYAIRVDGSLYITTESLVRNHTLVEMRAARTGLRLPADVLMSDEQVNLALLSTGGAATNPPSCTVADAVGRKDTVAILQFDETGELQRGAGKVLQISFEELPAAPYASLVFSLLTDLNVNGEGAPVVRGNSLAGLIMSYDPSSRTGKMIPYPILRRFLHDATSPPYRGVAVAGFTSKELVDPAQRAYLGVGNLSGGILVLSCIPGTGAEDVLRPLDVVLKWDGYEVDNMGYYDDPDFGRLRSAYLTHGRREVGDTVAVRIVRDGSEQTVNLTLTSYSDESALIPENAAERRPEYLIEGGMLLRELDGAYLRAHGANWMNQLDQRLVSLYLTRRQIPQNEGQRVVILAGVLPHPINVGYQHFHNHAVTHVNGRPVNNMADVFRIVSKDGHLYTLTLQSIGVDLVLDRSSLAQANKRLAEIYRIPRLRYQRGK